METEKKIEEQMTIEQAFARLDELVAQLEAGESSLEQSFDLYRQGMELVRLCSQKIDRVEKQLLTVSESGDTDEF